MFREYTKEDYVSCIENVIHEEGLIDCDNMSYKLYSLAREADERLEPLYRLFADVTSYKFVPDSPNRIFKPNVISRDMRSPLPDDLVNESLEFLSSVINDIKDCALKARVADVLYSERFGNSSWKYGRIAIENYLVSAKRIKSKYWSKAYKQLERSYLLFFRLGCHKKEVEENINVPSIIKDFIEDKNNCNFIRMKLIKLELENKNNNCIEFIETLEEIAEEFDKNIDGYSASEAWELLSRISSRNNNHEEHNNYKIKSAESFVKLAESGNDYMSKSYALQPALEIYRKVKGHKNRKSELNKLLVECQGKMNELFKHTTFNTDVTEIAKSSIEKVKDKDLFNALVSFALIIDPFSKDDVSKTLGKNNGFISDFICTTTIHNDKGAVISKIDNDGDNRLYFKLSSMLRPFYSDAIIEPALQQIRKEHTVSLNDFVYLVSYSPFVPEDRIHTYAHGLFHGFYGDYMSSISVLVPQVENSLRHLLKRNGEESSKVIDGGIQEESTINALLDNEVIIKLLGEKLSFDLRCLLIEKAGDNLRHNLAHGLLKDDDLFFSSSVRYFYWLIIRIILAPIISSQRKANSNKEITSGESK